VKAGEAKASKPASEWLPWVCFVLLFLLLLFPGGGCVALHCAEPRRASGGQLGIDRLIGRKALGHLRGWNLRGY